MARAKIEPLHERDPNFVCVVGRCIALVVDEVDRVLEANAVGQLNVAKAFLASQNPGCGLRQIEVLHLP